MLCQIIREWRKRRKVVKLPTDPRELARLALDRMPIDDPDRLIVEMWLNRDKMDYIALKMNCSRTTAYKRKNAAVQKWTNCER